MTTTGTGAQNPRKIRIGGASAYMGDSSMATPQLVGLGRVDYLVYDYLAEVTMSILSRYRAKNPDAGYATDFVDHAMKDVIREVASRNIKVLSNAGGMNPRACADALRKVMEQAGVNLKIAIVEGDNVEAQLERERGSIKEMFSGADLPKKLMSANAYLGALPVVEALRSGAQIVITGRCADSALSLAALIYEFGWSEADYDRMAAGSMVGHLLECGPQVSGGLHTDWRDVSGWEHIGYPLAECSADGSFVLTKAEGTGGMVSIGTVSEQLLYEIGDPAAYILPDVVCDLRDIKLEQIGKDQVLVTGFKGLAPTPYYKVTATYQDGWRSVGRMFSVGRDAPEKARATADMILKRMRNFFRARNLGDFRDTNLEIIGAEALYGPNGRAAAAREVMMRLTVEHEDRRALEVFSREIAPSSIASTPALLGGGDAGRPKVTPVVKAFSCLFLKADVPIIIDVDGERKSITVPAGQPLPELKVDKPESGASISRGKKTVELPLLSLAYARSGDKGDTSNVAVIARHAALVPVIRQQVTEKVVHEYFAHLVKGSVTRFEVPGVHGFNFLMTEALGGGGMATMRYDSLGKALGQMLLDIPINVPESLVHYCRTDFSAPSRKLAS